MGRSHLLAGAGVVLTALVFVGCSSRKPNQTAQRPGAIPTPALREGDSPFNDAHSGPGDSRAAVPAARVGDVAPRTLAQHTETYAHNLESLLARRGAATRPATAPTVDAPEAEPVATATGPQQDREVRSKRSVPSEAETPAVPNTPMKAASPPVEEPVAVVSVPTTRPAQPPAARPQVSSSEPATGAAQPAAARSVADASDLLFQRLANRVREYPRDAAAHLDYQLLQFLRDESVPDLGSIASLPAEDRELLTTLLDGVSNFRSALRAEANMLQSKKVAPLLEMGDRIRSQGELHIPAIALCTSVTTFGVYEPMEPASFHSGPNNTAVLYCEVANFSSQLNGKRQWETRLKHEAVIYTETGLDVWQDKSDTVTDQSRNRRHDFYVVKKLRLPNLPVGRYLLKVTVTDLQMNRIAESTVPIQMVAGQ